MQFQMGNAKFSCFLVLSTSTRTEHGTTRNILPWTYVLPSFLKSSSLLLETTEDDTHGIAIIILLQDFAHR